MLTEGDLLTWMIKIKQSFFCPGFLWRSELSVKAILANAYNLPFCVVHVHLSQFLHNTFTHCRLKNTTIFYQKHTAATVMLTQQLLVNYTLSLKYLFLMYQHV